MCTARYLSFEGGGFYSPPLQIIFHLFNFELLHNHLYYFLFMIDMVLLNKWSFSQLLGLCYCKMNSDSLEKISSWGKNTFFHLVVYINHALFWYEYVVFISLGKSGWCYYVRPLLLAVSFLTEIWLTKIYLLFRLVFAC